MHGPRTALVAASMVLMAGCRPADGPAESRTRDRSVTIGVAGTSGSDESTGIRQLSRNLAVEPLVNYDVHGRPVPFMAEKWTVGADGLSMRVQLRTVAFHDGTPLTASMARDSLLRGLPTLFGPLYDDIAGIRAASDHEIEFTFAQRTAFALEGLDIQVAKPDAPAVGTGPYMMAGSTDGSTRMVRNSGYYLGQPAVERVVFQPYPSTRAAWADLLRGKVDVLHEVGVDALDSLEPSSQVKVYSYRRHYAQTAIFNMRRQVMKDPAFRRRLNTAIDRQRLIDDALGGLGRPETNPVWPDHWANGDAPPGFGYAPEPIADAAHRISITCLFAPNSPERLVLFLQRQLQSVGVDLKLELVPVPEFVARLGRGDFELALTEAVSAPTLVRPYLFWHSKGPYNYGGFSSQEVDTALDGIRHAADDDAYRAGVAAFQRAIVNDPPAIFLAWTERARAVSAAFDVQAEPGRDVMSTLRLWQPAGPGPAAVRTN